MAPGKMFLHQEVLHFTLLYSKHRGVSGPRWGWVAVFLWTRQWCILRMEGSGVIVSAVFTTFCSCLHRSSAAVTAVVQLVEML